MRTEKHIISAPQSSARFELTSYHYGTPGRGKKVYIQAALHADEVPGMLVAQCLRKQLEALEAEGKVCGDIILVPAANPIGLSQAIHGAPYGRFDLGSGVNFNRGFKHVADGLKVALHGHLGANAEDNVRAIRQAALASVAAWQPRSDGEAHKKLLLQMAIDADIVLDLHCDNEAVLHLYAGTPLAEAVAPLAQLMGARALLLSTAAGGEPFDEACSRLWWDLQDHFGSAIPVPPACIAATVELRGEMDVSYELVQQDADALLRYLAGAGVLADDAGLPPRTTPHTTPEPPAPPCLATPLEGVEPLLAPQPGVLVYTRELGASVRAGDVVAELIDPVSGATSTVRCSVDGVFFARSAHRHVLRGWNIGKVAGTQAFRSGDLLSQ